MTEENKCIFAKASRLWNIFRLIIKYVTLTYLPSTVIDMCMGMADVNKAGASLSVVDSWSYCWEETFIYKHVLPALIEI